MKNFIKLVRPHQSLKNIFVFLPLFFNKNLMDLNYLIPTIMAFFAFTFAAFSIYCFNDIIDIDSDKKHPMKRERPLASGSVSLKQAYILMIFMLMISITIILAFLSKDNAPVMAFGVMGGNMQPQGHLQMLMHFVDDQLNPQACSDSPRWRIDDSGKLSPRRNR